MHIKPYKTLTFLAFLLLLAGCQPDPNEELPRLEKQMSGIPLKEQFAWLCSRTNNNRAAQFLLGRTLLEKFHRADGFDIVMASAQSDFGEALRYAANRLATGDGVIPEPFSAALLYDAAAATGKPDLQYEAGMYRALGPARIANRERALKYFEAAAQSGHSDACYQTGISYLKGLATPPNSEKARFWLEQAASKNHPQAQFALGILNLQSPGTQQKQGWVWIQKAATNGHSAAKSLIAAAQQSRGK